MILKYYELNKLNFDMTNFLLFHGKNEGYKSEEIEKITKKLSKKIVSYDERQIIDNIEEFFENNLNKSLFEDKKIILINRCTDKIIKIIEDLIEKGVNETIFILKTETLEKKSKLRNFFEKSKAQLVSIAFYPDNFDTLFKIAQKTLREKIVLLSNECINILVNKCASDRKNRSIFNRQKKNK